MPELPVPDAGLGNVLPELWGAARRLILKLSVVSGQLSVLTTDHFPTLPQVLVLPFLPPDTPLSLFYREIVGPLIGPIKKEWQGFWEGPLALPKPSSLCFRDRRIVLRIHVYPI